MNWKVRITGPAQRDLEQLPTALAARILSTIERFAQTEHGDIKKLQGASEEWRLRVGAYRVRFLRDEPSHTLEVLRVLPRGRAYRD
ncbi:MAG: type II toxin-antitoxin system RelE/ParE family toxin [Chloroflexi bacterium]|nr:type II toxin-antitoxin system RelE/ParE family toxin [Chloroflexota bacterium]